MGYDLHSLIPDVTFTGDIHSDVSDVTTIPRLMPVTSAFECAFQRDMRNFEELSTVPRSKVTTNPAVDTVSDSLSALSYVFGQGVLLSVDRGRVVVDVLDSANEILGILASTLLNNSEVVNLHYTVRGRDVHYFVKQTVEQAAEDVRELTLREDSVTIQGINVTIHRHHESPEVMKYADIRVHGNHTVLNVRYGTTVSQETQRVLAHAKDRAVRNAWLLELDHAHSNKQTINSWTRKQREELQQNGFIAGYHGEYIRDVTRYPSLADDPKNIRFVPHSR